VLDVVKNADTVNQTGEGSEKIARLSTTRKSARLTLPTCSLSGLVKVFDQNWEQNTKAKYHTKIKLTELQTAAEIHTIHDPELSFVRAAEVHPEI